MKKIPLLTVTISNHSVPDGFRLSYRNEFLQLVETVPEGIKISEMAALLGIVEKLNDLNSDSMILTDNEWTILQDRLKAAKFTIVAPEIVAMVAAVENATEV